MSNRKFPVFLFYILFLTTAIAINQGINAVSAVSFFIILFMAVVCRAETDIVLLFCLIPIQRIFMISRGFMTLVPLICIMIIVKCFFHHRVSRRCEKQVLAVIALFIYSSFVEVIRFSSVGNTMEYVLTIVLMIVICEIIDYRLRISCMSFYCISSMLSALVGYFFPTVSRFTALFTMEYNPRFQGLLADPGEFGQTMVCAVAMVITIYVMKREKTGFTELQKFEKKRVKLIRVIIYCAIFLYFGVLSGTRACLIAMVVIYIAVLIRLFQTKRKSIQLIAFLIGFVTVLALSSVAPLLFDVVSAAHGGESLSEDIRLSIWNGYLKNIRNNIEVILFGVGMNSCGMYGKLTGLGNPHSVIVEKIVECGLIGLFFNFLIFYPIIKRKKMSIRTPESLPFYVLLSTLIVYGSSGLILPYLLLALIFEKREEKNEYKKNISYD